MLNLSSVLPYAQPPASPREPIRAEAGRGLQESDRFYFQFWKKTELKTQAAERSLQELARIAAASGDPGTAHAVVQTLVAAETARPQPTSRLALLRRGLEAIESGVAAGVSNQAGLALSLYHATEDQASSTMARALVTELNRQAIADAAPEAAYVRFVDRLVDAGASPVQALQRLSSGSEKTATGYAARALDLAGGNTVVLERALEEIKSVSAGDALATAHLDRRNRLESLKSLSPSGCAVVDRITLQALRDKKPADAITVATLFGKERLSGTDGQLLTTALLDEAQAASPAGKPGDWLKLRTTLQGLGATGAALDAQILAGITADQDCNLPAAARVVEAVITGLGTKAPALATTEKLVDALAAIDKQAGGQRGAWFETFRRLASKIGTDDAMRIGILAEAAKGATTAPDPKKPLLMESAVASLAARTAAKTSDPTTVIKVGGAFLEEIETLARANGKSDLADFAQMSRTALGLRMAEEKQNVGFFNQAMKELQNPPADAAAYASAVDRLIGSTGYYLDRGNIARTILPALVTIADRGTDETLKRRVAVVAALARESFFDQKSQLTAVSAGLQYAAKPKTCTGSGTAHFGATLATSLSIPQDALRVANATVDVLETKARTGPDEEMLDACALLRLVAQIPSQEDKYQLAPVMAGLNWLASKQTFKGDPFYAFSLKVLQAVPQSYALQQSQIAEAVAEVLKSRAQRRKDVDDEGQVRFLQRIASQPFVGQESRNVALQKGLEAIANGTATQDDGLATVALSMIAGAKYYPDQIHIARAALAEAVAQVENAGNDARTLLLRTMQAAGDMPNYEDKYQVAIAQSALKLIARRPAPEPGELATVGLEMVNSAYYYVNTIEIGSLILGSMEQLAALENDKVYVPALVADVRNRMKAATSQKGQIDALRAGLKELSKLKGDAFRKALVAALQTGPDENAPKIEEAEEFVIINGIKVPRSKE